MHAIQTLARTQCKHTQIRTQPRSWSIEHVWILLAKQRDVVCATMTRNVHRHLDVAKLRTRSLGWKHRRTGESNTVFKRHTSRRVERRARNAMWMA